MIEVTVHDLVLPVPEGRETECLPAYTTHDVVMASGTRSGSVNGS